MRTIIYAFLISLSMIFGILINTPFVKYVALVAGILFQAWVIIFCAVALIEEHFFRTKTTHTKHWKCKVSD
ncbi:hypothetical protein SPACI_023690 [Sporomusa acidovorans DSM 3132]|uniref:Uncharacterized protein n=1 Tax=Sporomusa acidovorans (strain ATCC 49682 / DSM 3132 / Mol) TaxID=1123286 RepID=A0ABZ3J1U8_SPOA4|nr:hypothetical protein SPACI_08960 [Sporomusa acidovorans DSM 3132]SDE98440.1 hypothetical protein SAMN04488499_102882 [Sporomusa acidovorans]